MDDLGELRAVEIGMDGQKFLAHTEMVGHTFEVFKALKLLPPKLI